MTKFDAEKERKKLQKELKKPRDPHAVGIDIRDVALKAFDFFARTDPKSRKAQSDLLKRVREKG